MRREKPHKEKENGWAKQTLSMLLSESSASNASAAAAALGLCKRDDDVADTVPARFDGARPARAGRAAIAADVAVLLAAAAFGLKSSSDMSDKSVSLSTIAAKKIKIKKNASSCWWWRDKVPLAGCGMREGTPPYPPTVPPPGRFMRDEEEGTYACQPDVIE